MKKNRAPQLPASHRRHFDNSRSAHWSGRPRTVAFLAGLLVLLLAQAGGRAAVGAVERAAIQQGLPRHRQLRCRRRRSDAAGEPCGEMATPPGRSRSAARPPAVRTSSRRISTSRRSIRTLSRPTPQIQRSASSSEVRRSVRPSGPSRNRFRATARHVGDQRARALSQYRCTARTCSRSCPNSSTRKASGLESTSSTAQSFPRNAQHTVTLREKTGNSAIQTAGATLFLVYRVTTPDWNR